MNIRSLTILIGIVVALLLGFGIYRTYQNTNGLQDGASRSQLEDTPEFNRFARGLDPNVFTEENIDKTITAGMTPSTVESILGEPYRRSPFMGSLRASYRINDKRFGVLKLTGFTVVYKEDRVAHVDKEWGTQ
jgi:hypothetical protein